jgi:hypothetical protein
MSANRFPGKGKGNQGPKSKDKSKEKCRRCQKLGHYAYKCRAEKPVDKGSENTQNVKGHYGDTSPKLVFMARRPEYQPKSDHSSSELCSEVYPEH